MQYSSTRDKTCSVSSAQAIMQGLSREGGLFVPQQMPAISLEFIGDLIHNTYAKRAMKILSLFLTDFTTKELETAVSHAYGVKFEDSVSPLSKLSPDTYLLELWHGPTCAFKDMALQLLPYLMTAAAKKLNSDKTILILVATSGDTGKAALDGFADVEGTKITVLYPNQGVSVMQHLQMVTQQGENVKVCGVEGNFDDAQNTVKRIFTSKDIAQTLDKQGIVLSSANSINWGRLVPQIVYYFSAYADLVGDEEIVLGDPINVVVPTGNFGNILAAYYAKKMGLPIVKLICASNSNNVLTDFIQTGKYDRNRVFFPTVSPSMDILISSNLERLLFDLAGDDKIIVRLMESLASTGSYTVDPAIHEKLAADFYAGFCDDAETLQQIDKTFKEFSYICDTHTAVALKVYEDYRNETKDNTKTIVVSTASPYKFGSSILKALEVETTDNEFETVEKLFKITNLPIPTPITELNDKAIRFKESYSPDEIFNHPLNLF